MSFSVCACEGVRVLRPWVCACVRVCACACLLGLLGGLCSCACAHEGACAVPRESYSYRRVRWSVQPCASCLFLVVWACERLCLCARMCVRACACARVCVSLRVSVGACMHASLRLCTRSCTCVRACAFSTGLLCFSRGRRARAKSPPRWGPARSARRVARWLAPQPPPHAPQAGTHAREPAHRCGPVWVLHGRRRRTWM
jgi:hypothetical protein